MCIKKLKKGEHNLELNKTSSLYPNKTKYKNKKLIIISTIVISLEAMVILLPLLGYLIFAKNINYYDLPDGKLVQELVSPTGEYTLQAYFEPKDTDNYPKDNAIRVRMYDNKTKTAGTIYYKRPENKVAMKWLDEENFQINDIKFNVFDSECYWDEE